MFKIRTLTALAALGFAASGSAFAQSPYPAPWAGDFWGYIGASAGDSRFHADCAGSQAFSCDKRDTAWKVYAGGKFNDIFSLEAGFTDFGRIDASGGTTKAWAVPVTLVATAPLPGRFAVFGKLGGLYGRTDVSANPATLVQAGKKSAWGWTYGAGATFSITKNLQLRTDWDRYKLEFASGRSDVDMVSAGLQLRY